MLGILWNTYGMISGKVWGKIVKLLKILDKSVENQVESGEHVWKNRTNSVQLGQLYGLSIKSTTILKKWTKAGFHGPFSECYEHFNGVPIKLLATLTKHDMIHISEYLDNVYANKKFRKM